MNIHLVGCIDSRHDVAYNVRKKIGDKDPASAQVAEFEKLVLAEHLVLNNLL